MSNSCTRRLIVAAALAVLSLVASSCADPVRPTLTAEPPAETASTQAPSVAPTVVAPPTETAATSGPVETGTSQPESEASNGEAGNGEAEVEQLVVEVLESFPHDPDAFTQGLELHNGVFVESTGLYGESDLRRVDPTTGEVLDRVDVAPEFFAEGLTRVDDRLIQLTWQENTAFYYDAETFAPIGQAQYEGEGWGLCYDGERLIMTDGRPELILRDPATFDELGRVAVTINGQDVFNLNEVECVDGDVWANIWQTDQIVRIDPSSGAVTAIVDATSLDSPDGPSGAVLNGIAWDEASQSFYVTGKLWPTMYRVRFVPAG